MRTIGAWPVAGGARFRVWAPASATLHVRMEPRVGGDVALDPQPGGWFAGFVPEVEPGQRYRYVLDSGLAIPDPASRFQPEGVHGPSELVDPSAFVWRTQGWQAPGLDALVVYELHIGTFTPEGTFAAAIGRLDWLAALGVTAIELMPVAAFPGRRNWGYDGAALFAPSERYGHPDDLRRLVDEAHARGLAVLLDVVYNHFGPDGAYAVAASPSFLGSAGGPWGATLNFDGPGSEHVRHVFVENACHWLAEYRVDGLRLDATHAMHDGRPRHVVAEICAAARRAVDRPVLLVVEDARNDRRVLEPPDDGGWGADAVWADDFHHVARRWAAGDSEGYYRDYRGTAVELATTLRDGWLARGGPSVHLGHDRGTAPDGLDLARFVICLQNHDQVGNRATGERLHHQVDLATWRALSTVLLLAPETPLLFMGQEWAATAPFCFFTDHAGALGEAVREGRRREFARFAAFGDGRAVPDPQAEDTFTRSRLDWHEVTAAPHAQVAACYRALLALRRTLAGAGPSGALTAGAAGDDGVWFRRVRRGGGELVVVARTIGAGELAIPAIPAGWTRVLDTERPEFAGARAPIATRAGAGHLVVAFARPGALVIRTP